MQKNKIGLWCYYFKSLFFIFLFFMIAIFLIGIHEKK